MHNVRRSRLILLLLMSTPLWADSLAENQSRFGAITGDVGLLALGAPDWIEPHDGLPLEVGDHIRTGEDGTAELVLSENAVWILQPETDVVIEHTEANSGQLDLSSGTLIGKLDSEHTAGIAQHWEFNTPTAVVGVRGTEFGIVASKRDGTHLGVFEGIVDLEPAETAEGIQPPVKVTGGQEGVVRRGKPVQVLKTFSHTMIALSTKRTLLRKRFSEIQNTWSPFTVTVRADLRKKFVAPVPKTHRIPPRTAPRRRSHSAGSPLQ